MSKNNKLFADLITGKEEKAVISNFDYAMLTNYKNIYVDKRNKLPILNPYYDELFNMYDIRSKSLEINDNIFSFKYGSENETIINTGGNFKCSFNFPSITNTYVPNYISVVNKYNEGKPLDGDILNDILSFSVKNHNYANDTIISYFNFETEDKKELEYNIVKCINWNYGYDTVNRDMLYRNIADITLRLNRVIDYMIDNGFILNDKNVTKQPDKGLTDLVLALVSNTFNNKSFVLNPYSLYTGILPELAKHAIGPINMEKYITHIKKDSYVFPLNGSKDYADSTKWYPVYDPKQVDESNKTIIDSLLQISNSGGTVASGDVAFNTKKPFELQFSNCLTDVKEFQFGSKDKFVEKPIYTINKESVDILNVEDNLFSQLNLNDIISPSIEEKSYIVGKTTFEKDTYREEATEFNNELEYYTDNIPIKLLDTQEIAEKNNRLYTQNIWKNVNIVEVDNNRKYGSIFIDKTNDYKSKEYFPGIKESDGQEIKISYDFNKLYEELGSNKTSNSNLIKPKLEDEPTPIVYREYEKKGGAFWKLFIKPSSDALKLVNFNKKIAEYNKLSLETASNKNFFKINQRYLDMNFVKYNKENNRYTFSSGYKDRKWDQYAGNTDNFYTVPLTSERFWFFNDKCSFWCKTHTKYGYTNDSYGIKNMGFKAVNNNTIMELKNIINKLGDNGIKQMVLHFGFNEGGTELSPPKSAYTFNNGIDKKEISVGTNKGYIYTINFSEDKKIDNKKQNNSEGSNKYINAINSILYERYTSTSAYEKHIKLDNLNYVVTNPDVTEKSIALLLYGSNKDCNNSDYGNGGLLVGIKGGLGPYNVGRNKCGCPVDNDRLSPFKGDNRVKIEGVDENNFTSNLYFSNDRLDFPTNNKNAKSPNVWGYKTAIEQMNASNYILSSSGRVLTKIEIYLNNKFLVGSFDDKLNSVCPIPATANDTSLKLLFKTPSLTTLFRFKTDIRAITRHTIHCWLNEIHNNVNVIINKIAKSIEPVKHQLTLMQRIYKNYPDYITKYHSDWNTNNGVTILDMPMLPFNAECKSNQLEHMMLTNTLTGIFNKTFPYDSTKFTNGTTIACIDMEIKSENKMSYMDSLNKLLFEKFISTEGDTAAFIGKIPIYITDSTLLFNNDYVIDTEKYMTIPLNLDGTINFLELYSSSNWIGIINKKHSTNIPNINISNGKEGTIDNAVITCSTFKYLNQGFTVKWYLNTTSYDDDSTFYLMYPSSNDIQYDVASYKAHTSIGENEVWQKFTICNYQNILNLPKEYTIQK